MKGTIGVLAMFWAMSAWGVEAVVEVEALGGRKQLSEKAFSGLSEQNEAGMRLSVARRPDATFGLVVDYLEARAERSGDGFRVGAITREYGIGVRGKIDGDRVDAVASCGVAFLQTELAAAYALRTWRIKEEGVGAWYSLGVRVPMTSRLTAGVDFRHTIGTVSGKSHAHSTTANAFHVGATISMRFGRTARVAR